MRVLHIMGQDISGNIFCGGQQGAKKNHEILKRVFGEENTYLLMLSKNIYHKQNEKIFVVQASVSSLENILVSLVGYRRFNPLRKKNIIDIIDRVNPDVIFLDSSELGKITRWFRKDINCLVNFHNIEVDYVWNNKIKRKKIYALPILGATYYNEKIAISRANKIICLNERDNKRLKKIYKCSADLILPVGFEDKFKRDKIRRNIEERTLIFIGSLFPPNFQGIQWFVQKVMAELEDFELLIIGKGFENKRKELERSNVKVVGTVENLEEYYYSYCSVVMPILYGDGMKIKTAEAMMYGMNIFATSEALEGYKSENVDGIYRCENKEEFINNIKEAYKKHKIYRVAEEVRNSFLENNSLELQVELMKKIVERE